MRALKLNIIKKQTSGITNLATRILINVKEVARKQPKHYIYKI